MRTTIYGIANCDTIKKARAWLAARGIEHAFHDYKKMGVDPAVLAAAVERFGWEKVLNRQGTTFRKLPEEDRTGLVATRALALMEANPSAIERPLLVHNEHIELGFDAQRYETLFA
ncbi:arsenate reductase [Sphingomonas sp. NBWT7]|uniref:arsenate reductase n=1 Tax=Sphingomonas sp. NBWT7 TaxID=2596913 RepID=UPI0016290A9B|nr:arsenate reductase [Sphingomonas sp. NBWT7]QNE31483.1 arsenate reductase [Sphingomonas sp. NBWT7]